MTGLISYLRQNKVIYFAVFLEAVILLLTAFGFLPPQALLVSTLLAMAYMTVLRPVEAVRFFILSVPWTVALPLGGYDKLQNWRLLVAEAFIIALAYKWPQFRSAFKRGLGGLVKFFKLSKIDLAFLGYLAVTILLLLVNPGFLLPGLKQVVTYLNLYAIFVTARLVIENEADRKAVLKSLALSALMVVLAGFAQLAFFLRTNYIYFWQTWANTFLPVIYGREYAGVSTDANTWFSYYINQPPGLRMFSLMPGSQVFAMISLFSMVFLLAWSSVVETIKAKRWLFALAAVSALAMVLTSVRASVVGSFVPLALLFGLWLFKRISKRDLRRGLIPVAIFLAAFLVSPLTQMALNEASLIKRDGGSLLERTSGSTSLEYQSNAARLTIWKQSWESIKRHPLFGVGIGNFALVFEEDTEGKSFDEIIQTKEEFVNVTRKSISAHNILLQVLVESGLVGLVAFLVFTFIVVGHILKVVRAGDGLKATAALMFGVAFAWIIGHGMFDSVFLTDDEPLTYFWLGLALLADQE